MRAIAFVVLSTFALAACDAPDPSEFHHSLRSDAMTGTHVNGAVGSSEVSTEGSGGIDKAQRSGLLNTNGGH
jgi:hypothetical protein